MVDTAIAVSSISTRTEEKIGVVKFDLSSDGSYRGRTTLAIARQRVIFTLDLETDGSRRWTKVVVGSSLGVMTVQRQGGRADMILPGSSVSVRVPRDCLVYDALAPALIDIRTGD
jgi:hypothetical protein